MNILISNDDGIAAIGIKKLAQFLGLVEGCRVYVCAPDSERSNIGHGITIRSDLYLTEVPADGFGPAAVWAASCSGTPADCVRLALSVLKEKGVQIDMVCGGINNGLNCGTDINYSGTIAVCREAVIDGVPEAIAFSSSTGMAYVDNFSFIIPDIIKKYAGNIPKDHLLNVNVLDRPWSDVKGYAAASLAVNTYPPSYTLMDDEDAAPVRQRYKFASFSLDSRDRDGYADTTLLRGGYVTVSLIPLLPDALSAMPLAEELLPRKRS